MIVTENDINSATAKALRESMGLSVAKFWAPIGLTQSAGWKIESASTPNPVQKCYQRLIFLHYVAKINVIADKPEAAKRLIDLGRRAKGAVLPSVEKNMDQARKAVAKVRTKLVKAGEDLGVIADTLG